MRKLELIRCHRMEQENEHLKAYKRMFPEVRPNIFQLELIENTVTDTNAWRKTLEYWAGNDYRPQSVFKMLEYYKQVLSGTVRTFEDPMKAKARVGAPQPVIKTWDCDQCFDLGTVDVPDPSVPILGMREEVCECQKNEASSNGSRA